MIHIDRSKLLESIKEFARAGSGLIVGSPGVGKTYILQKLKEAYLDNNIVCFMIKIDNLSEASDNAIESELDIKNWLDTFKQIKVSDDQKALLIFDAFDAARDEGFRKAILDQIRKAKRELSNKWNILVSVRTYDAEKSTQLIQLFPKSENFKDFVNCRKYTIQLLTDGEVRESIAGNTKFENYYQGANKAIQDVLRVPFFLNLADTILQETNYSELEELKRYKSETQLLKRYWDLKVKGTYQATDIEKVLIDLTELLVRRKTLSVAKKDFIPLLKDTVHYNYLLSEWILEEISNQNRVAFRHNILFDYAVSVLYLVTEEQAMIHLIREDHSRPFFLRPSFLYFFTNLWYNERQLFWKFYWAFYYLNESIFQLFVRLILTGVVASEYSNEKDLEPITQSAASARKDLIRNMLQSLRFIKTRTTKQDFLFLKSLSTSLDLLYTWEFSFLLERAIKDEKKSPEEAALCGIAGRNLLSFIRELPDSPHKQAADRLGAAKGIEMVCLTYGTDITASKKLLSSLFTLLNTENFEIGYFTNLAQYSKDILPYDAAFVGEIYRVLFRHEENSNAETVMGSSVLMNFRSNRRQDFESTLYFLTELFPQFLIAAPELAIPAGIDITNIYVTKDRSSYGYGLAPEEFTLKSFSCRYVFDHSSLWSTNIYSEKPQKLVENIIEYFKNQLQAEKFADLKRYLDLYILNATVGYTWKAILEFGILALPKLPDYFFDFCLEPVFYTSTDTSFEIRGLIEKGATYFSKDQMLQIERLIHFINKEYEEIVDDQFLRRFLSRIPIEQLQLPASQEIFSKEGPMKNEPPISFTSYSGVVTTEEWLQESGVDISPSIISELLKAQQKLNLFTHRWLNDAPLREDMETYLPFAYQVFLKVKAVIETVDKRVIDGTLLEVAQAYACCCRNIKELLPDEFEQAKEVLLYSFQYHSRGDEIEDSEQSAARAYSPTARIAASEALPLLATRDNSPEFIELAASAVRDRNAIVRLNASRQLSKLKEVDSGTYWELIKERLQQETDAMVASTLLANTIIEKNDEAGANEILQVAYSNEKLFSWDNSFIGNFVLFAVKLWIHRQNELADQILSEAWKRDAFQRDVVFETFNEMRILSLGNQELKRAYMSSVTRWTSLYLDKAAENLKALSQEQYKNDNPQVKSALTLIDLVIQRCYFVLQRGGRQDKHFFQIPDESRRGLYEDLKPLFAKVIHIPTSLAQGGFIIGHTAHYFIQALNACLEYDPKNILEMVVKITQLSMGTGYTFDSMAIREVVALTERLLADHRDLLTQPDSFNHLIYLLDTYMQSGWNDALELLWKLDEIFK